MDVPAALFHNLPIFSNFPQPLYLCVSGAVNSLEPTLSLAIFDLDNTLIAGDSDHYWNQFLVERDLVDAEVFKQANDRFYKQYKDGSLDIEEYLTFALQPLTRFSMPELEALHRDFMREKIEPLYLPEAAALVDYHRQRGDALLVITATNSFIAGPIARWLGIDDVLACDPEIVDGRFSGRTTNLPCFQEGKVTRLQEWMKEHDQSLRDSYFYSDSVNDVPLLQQVTYPTAVDPCPRLRDHAQAQGWPVISLRQAQ